MFILRSRDAHYQDVYRRKCTFTMCLKHPLCHPKNASYVHETIFPFNLDLNHKYDCKLNFTMTPPLPSKGIQIWTPFFFFFLSQHQVHENNDYVDHNCAIMFLFFFFRSICHHIISKPGCRKTSLGCSEKKVVV